MAKKLSKQVKKQIINIAFLVVLIGVTMIVLFTSQDINLVDIGDFLRGCKPWYIVAALGCMLGYIVFEAISLHIIARTLGHKSKFVSSMAYSSSDLYYSAITPSASGGQPASAFYMMRDGMSGGTAGFTVLFNIISYTVATILVGLFGMAVCPAMFHDIGHWFAKTLIIFGFVVQFLLLAALLLCLFRSRIIVKIGNFGISALAKIKIIKNADKQRERLNNMVKKYRACRSLIKKHPMLFLIALSLNTAQRVSQTLIPCFVVFAAKADVNFLELFCMQAYVLIGYNSIPLPGGTGAYEYLYPNVFGAGSVKLDMTFMLSAMMVSRAISYYLCMVVSGIYTLIYHAVGIRKVAPPADIDAYTALESQEVLGAISEAVGEQDETPQDVGEAETPQDNTEATETVQYGEINTQAQSDGEVNAQAESDSESSDTGSQNETESDGN